MHFKPSDLPLLVSLDMLLEERNVTRAASKLHVSQPALSAQLARLRRLFKDPLLVPSETGRGMVPTPKAEEMAVALRDALSQLGTLGDPLDDFEPRCDTATFCVGGSFSGIGTFAKPLIRAFQGYDNRDLRVGFRVGGEDTDILAQFENGQIDILLVANEQVPSSLKYRQLIADRFVLVQRKDHPRGRAPVTVEEYCSLGHMIVSNAGRMHGLMDTRLKELGLCREVLVSAPHSDIIGPVITSTDLVCTVPQSMLGEIGHGVEFYAIPFDMPDISLAMAWHARLDKQPSHRWLRDELVHISRRLHPTRHAEDTMPVFPMLERPRDGYH